MVTTVISHQRATAVTINAGLKALTVEYGMPRPVDPRLEVLRLADEHAWVAVYEDMPLHVADSILLIPAHIDPAINLHDVLFAWDARSATLEPWAVDARRVELDEWLG